MGNGIRLLLMVFVGFLFIMVGVHGGLGSMLGAILTPAYMQGPIQIPTNVNPIIPGLGGLPGT